MKKGFIGLVFLWVTQICCAQFSLRSDQPIKLACDNAEEKVVQTALKLFIRDYQSVFSASAAVDARQGNIIVGTVGKSPLLKAVSADVSALTGKKQAFLLQVLPDGKLLVAGSDSHGTAYGIMELSRLIGVSPWEWWADVTPEKKTSFVLSAEYQTLQSPSVEYRGIFINDEDWGLMPWSSQTYEPSDIKGHIGPKTNARIFELLLRLRANTYWPAMHECTLPFFLTEGNRKVAEEYGIFIGSSHCEPMVCSAAGEWRRRGQGDYDYVNNSASVYKFWEDRVKEVAQQGNIYTLGMRGVHDGQMQGAKTVAEQKAVLERVLKDQRGLLQKYGNKDVTAIPQAFIPYKEVLDIYNAGLQVPDDVTLIWCDDNYGYIRHFPTAEERIETLNRLLADATKGDSEPGTTGNVNQEVEDGQFFRKILLQQLGIIRLVATQPTSQNQDLLRRISGITNRELPVESLLVWEDLYPVIDRIYDGFYTQMNRRFGSVLIDKEQQLCCLLCAEFSTKEISVVTQQSIPTIYQRKTNIRKKLGMGEKEDIVSFILEK